MSRLSSISTVLMIAASVPSCRSPEVRRHVPYSSMRTQLEKEYGPATGGDDQAVLISSDLLGMLTAGANADVAGFGLGTDSGTTIGILALRGNESLPSLGPESQFAQTWSGIPESMVQQWPAGIQIPLATWTRASAHHDSLAQQWLSTGHPFKGAYQKSLAWVQRQTANTIAAPFYARDWYANQTRLAIQQGRNPWPYKAGYLAIEANPAFKPTKFLRGWSEGFAPRNTWQQRASGFAQFGEQAMGLVTLSSSGRQFLTRHYAKAGFSSHRGGVYGEFGPIAQHGNAAKTYVTKWKDLSVVSIRMPLKNVHNLYSAGSMLANAQRSYQWHTNLGDHATLFGNSYLSGARNPTEFTRAMATLHDMRYTVSASPITHGTYIFRQVHAPQLRMPSPAPALNPSQRIR